MLKFMRPTQIEPYFWKVFSRDEESEENLRLRLLRFSYLRLRLLCISGQRLRHQLLIMFNDIIASYIIYNKQANFAFLTFSFKKLLNKCQNSSKLILDKNLKLVIFRSLKNFFTTPTKKKIQSYDSDSSFNKLDVDPLRDDGVGRCIPDFDI